MYITSISMNSLGQYHRRRELIKMKKLSKSFVCLLMTTVVVMPVSMVSSIAPHCSITSENNGVQRASYNVEDIMWDNGMEEVTTPFSSQLGFTDGTLYDVYTADDFIFDEEITVTSVFWTGLYFNCQQAQGPKDYHFPWSITFFEHDGSYEPNGGKPIEDIIIISITIE